MNIGDRIKVTDRTSPHYPKVGHIIKIGDKRPHVGIEYIVQFLFDDEDIMFECEMERI